MHTSESAGRDTRQPHPFSAKSPEHAFLLGNPELDGDHIILAELTDKLEAACDEGLSPEVAWTLMDNLQAKVRDHFHHETACMERDGYPLLAQHREEHAVILAYIDGLLAYVKDGSISLDAQLVKDLRSWHWWHIMHRDSEYAEYARAKNSPEEATRRLPELDLVP